MGLVFWVSALGVISSQLEAQQALRENQLLGLVLMASRGVSEQKASAEPSPPHRVEILREGVWIAQTFLELVWSRRQVPWLSSAALATQQAWLTCRW